MSAASSRTGSFHRSDQVVPPDGLSTHVKHDRLKTYSTTKVTGLLMSMTATARRTGGLKHEVDVNGRHTIVTDEPQRLGGTDQGPAPHELLAATLASCVATMIAMYAQNHDWNLGDTAVDVDYDADAVPRRFIVNIHLPSDLTPEQQRKLERVAETCPVRRALETGFAFEECIVPSQTPTAA